MFHCRGRCRLMDVSPPRTLEAYGRFTAEDAEGAEISGKPLRSLRLSGEKSPRLHESNLTFADVLDRVASRYPHKTAVKFEDTSYTYAQLRARVDGLAGALIAMGVRKGDRIAVLAPNCHQYLELYLVCTLMGAILVPLNTRLNSQELQATLDDSEPVALVVEGDFQDCFEGLRPRLSSVRHLLHIGRPFHGSQGYEELASRDVTYTGARASAEDVNCILYTGGTTGFPKGAMLTNGGWIANTVNGLPALGATQDDVNLVVTPLFHTAAVWPALMHLYVGGTSVITRGFDAKDALEVIERERITFSHPVLSQVVALLEEPGVDGYDLSSLRTIQCTMSLPIPAFRRALKVFGNIVVPGYGLTEAGPMASLMPRSEMESWTAAGKDGPSVPSRYGSSGVALPNVEIRLVDDAGQEVPRGEVGEIAVRSRSLMKGYWKKPEASAEALRDGWLWTGDMARMDEEGFLYFVDRKNGMIKTGGESVYPKEVEDAILSHPAVLEVAVFGVPDAKWGETVKAVVALRQGATATERSLIEHCRRRIASYKKPTSIDFIEALPRNPSGKVIKSELRAKYGDR